MTVTIIDAFEMIDVQHADRHRVALHREVLEQFVGGRPEAGPVQRTGQVIVVGQVFHLPLRAAMMLAAVRGVRAINMTPIRTENIQYWVWTS